jgi:MFS family permease
VGLDDGGTKACIELAPYGLLAPFAAALMDRFGIRWVTSLALVLVAAGTTTNALAFSVVVIIGAVGCGVYIGSRREQAARGGQSWR